MNHNGSDHVVKLEKEIFSNRLHCFSNSTIVQTFTNSQSLFQYDLITGNLFNIKVMFSSGSKICSDNENMYLISRNDNLLCQNDYLLGGNDDLLYQNDDRLKIKVSVLCKTGDNEVLQFCKVNSFSVNKLVKL